MQSRARRLHYPAKKKAVGINLSPQVVDYFKAWRRRPAFLTRN